jgi:hypothetical protein
MPWLSGWPWRRLDEYFFLGYQVVAQPRFERETFDFQSIAIELINDSRRPHRNRLTLVKDYLQNVLFKLLSSQRTYFTKHWFLSPLLKLSTEYVPAVISYEAKASKYQLRFKTHNLCLALAFCVIWANDSP